MANHKSLLIASVLSMLFMGALATPMLGVAAKTSLATEQERLEVRQDEEVRLASLDKSYAKQQRTLAKQYRKAAKEVQKQGGDSTALLEAAAYFDGQAGKQEKREKTIAGKDVMATKIK